MPRINPGIASAPVTGLWRCHGVVGDRGKMASLVTYLNQGLSVGMTSNTFFCFFLRQGFSVAL